MKILNFLFFGVFRVFKLVPRKGFDNVDLASTFFSILLSTNILTFLFLIKIAIDDVDVKYKSLIKGVTILIFVLTYILVRRNYIKKEKYRYVIKSLTRYHKKSRVPEIIGIIYCFITFALFILIAMFVGNR